MWDRHYWRATRRAFKYQQRQAFRTARDQQRQAYRAARRSYRYGRHRGNPFFALLLLILIASFIGHAWYLIPLVILGGCLFMWLRSTMFGRGSTGGFGNNYQQSNQYYQQPQPNQYYQPSNEAQANTPYTPPYQSYEQGYQTPPKNEQQQNAQPYQPYQGNPAPSTSEQYYEEPQAQYPQEMPPMG